MGIYPKGDEEITWLCFAYLANLREIFKYGAHEPPLFSLDLGQKVIPGFRTKLNSLYLELQFSIIDSPCSEQVDNPVSKLHGLEPG